MNDLSTFYLPHSDGPSSGAVMTMRKDDIVKILDAKYFCTEEDIAAMLAYRCFVEFLEAAAAHTNLFHDCVINGHDIYLGDSYSGYAKVDMRTNKVEYIRGDSLCPQGGLVQ